MVMNITEFNYLLIRSLTCLKPRYMICISLLVNLVVLQRVSRLSGLYLARVMWSMAPVSASAIESTKYITIHIVLLVSVIQF